MPIIYNHYKNPAQLETIKQAAELLICENPAFQKRMETLQVTVSFASSSKLQISKKAEQCSILCQEPAHFFRGLNYLLHHTEEDFQLEEEPFFTKNGFMLDCSRNAVATVSTVKRLIRILAKAGMNQLLLYTEDTYEVPELPYFGIYRGRYSKEELLEIDAYASMFGIELVPCIQTLAHLRNYLKWSEAEPVKDSSDILLVGSPETYDMIRRLLTALKDCFQTRNIHIGMDEAVFLGLGTYLQKHGYTSSSELIQEHSKKVQNICRELGWNPMIWSDMYISTNTKKGYYCVDENTCTKNWKKPDSDLGLVYWDYYHMDQTTYENQFRVHKELSDWIIFASGIWNWNGIAPNYGKAISCMQAGMNACRIQGIHETFTTGWMDNGAETPLDAIYPGLIAFAHLCFHSELSLSSLEQEFLDCMDVPLKSFLLLDDFDSLFREKGKNFSTDNPSKYLLYQDALLGMFDYHIRDIDTRSYYKNLAEQLEQILPSTGSYRTLFEFYHTLAQVLTEKADLGVRLKRAYDSRDLSTLSLIEGEVIPKILDSLAHMHLLREELWLKDAKPFGYELLDIKLGGVSSRLKSCKRRISAYLNGQIPALEELEAERLPYWNNDLSLRENIWSRIVSGCELVDTI